MKIGVEHWRGRWGCLATTVNKWSQRFERLAPDGLTDRPGRGAKASISPAVVEEVLAKAGQDAPGMRRRSTRTMARNCW